MKVLISAYACEPERGSESEVGWNWVIETARVHDTWVITRRTNQHAIEMALGRLPEPRIHFTYVDLPKWLRIWKQLPCGVQAYYYLWQLLAYLPAKRLDRKEHFDVVQHATFCTYWQPSLMALLPAPFVWGPVGGGEAAPRAFLASISLRGRLYEVTRKIAQKIAMYDPLLRLTARSAAIALATTQQTADRLVQLGCKNVHLFTQVALNPDEIEALVQHSSGHRGTFRICSAGRLEHLKGLHITLQAVAKLRDSISAIEYWIFGTGPEQERLEELAQKLGISQNVIFWGEMPRPRLLEKLTECDVLLHAGLHESGGLVCMEAMAAGCPVVCLDLGGLSVQVTDHTGIKVPALSPQQAATDLAAALESLAVDPVKLAKLSTNARNRAAMCSWRIKTETLWTLLIDSGVTYESPHLSQSI